MLYVNGEKIQDDQIEAEARRLRADYEKVFADKDKDHREKQLLEWSRENVIESALLRQAAMRDINDISDEQIEKTYNGILDQQGGREQFLKNNNLTADDEPNIKNDIAGRMKFETLMARITEKVSAPDEKAVKQYYEENAERFIIPESVKASHIVKHPADDCDPAEQRKVLEQVLTELRAGADFAEMAQKHSDCPDNGGDLGYFAKGRMVPAFEEAAFNMDAGQVSDIFQTEFGMHIAKVTDKKPALPCTLQQVTELIVKELTQQQQQKAIEKFVDAEKAKATIEDK